jgi:diguanylate cyclase (GGDEF)-like protein/PAS domain S-box-containing protein
MVFTTLWTLCYLLGLSSPKLEGKIFWLRVKYIPACLVPILWFYFSLQFTHELKWLQNQKLKIAIIVYALVTWCIVFSSDYHGLMWKAVWINPGLLEEEALHGFYFWVYIAVSYFFLTASFVNYTKFFIRSSKIYKGQALSMVFGSLIPMLVSILFLAFGFDIIPQLDESILSFLISGIIFSGSIFGLHTFEIIPIAHDLVIRNMNIGLIVFDFNNIVVEINALAERLLGIKMDQVIGKPAKVVFAGEDEVFSANDISEDSEREIIHRSAQEQRYFIIHQSPIFDKKHDFFGRVTLITDITERKKNEIMLNNFATIDELSKIYNRRYFYSLAEKELSRAKRYQRSCSIVLFDIDNFKMFNDIYGHAMGDDVIFHVASIIKKSIRDSDLFGRFGGDEFICLFPEIDKNCVVLTVKRLQQILMDNAYNFEDKVFAITMSFGIAHFNGTPDTTIENLIKNADFAMLQAKKLGKDCYQVWEELPQK